MTGKPVTPPEFDKAMTQLLTRLGLPPFSPAPQAYRLNLGSENPLYFTARPGGWLEILTPVGYIAKDTAGTAVPALLALQHQPGDGALISIGMDSQNGKVSARMRLRFSDCHPDDMIAAVQALRAHAAVASTLMNAKPTQKKAPVGPVKPGYLVQLADCQISNGSRVQPKPQQSAK